MQKLVFINGAGNEIDLTAGNFGIVNWAGLSNTSLNIQTQQVPFEDGGVFLDALMEQREIEVTVAIYDGNNLELRYQKKRELISALNPKLGEGTLIYTNDYLSRQIKAVPQIPLFENKNSNDVGTLKASVAFSCPSPYWEDVEETKIYMTYSKREKAINDGDVPVNINVEIITTGVKNVAIENTTNAQKIEYNGQLNDNLRINTRVGQKSVESFAYIYNLINNNKLKSDIIYVEKLGFYVAVCSDGTIQTSPDGENWTERFYTGTKYQLNSIAFSEELNMFVAVGGMWVISYDGINWVKPYGSSSGSNARQQRKIIWCKQKNKFYVVGDNASVSWQTVRYSSDGLTWETIDINNYTANFLSITYSSPQNKFVIVTSSGDAITSDDEETWNITNVTTRFLYDVKYIGFLNKYIAVGTVGVIYTSQNGETWESVTSNTTRILYSVCYSELLRLFIVVGENIILYSNDGINWNIINKDISLYNVIYSNYKNDFVACGEKLYFSSNGVEWETKNTGAGGSCVEYSEDLKIFVAISDGIWTSSDGIYWEKRIADTHCKSCKYIPFCNKFVVSGYHIIYTSSDGENWNSIVIDGSGGQICYSDDLIVIAGVNKMFTSPDGENWTERQITLLEGTEAGSFDVEFCVYNSDLHLFLVAGRKQIGVVWHFAIVTSTNGINWAEIQTNLTTGNCYALTYSNLSGVFVMNGSNNKVLLSKDGLYWDTADVQGLDSKRVSSLKYNHYFNIIMGVYAKGVVFSTDAYSWKSIELSSGDLKDIAYSKELNQYCIVGTNGLIYLSNEKMLHNEIMNINDKSNMGLSIDVGDNTIKLNYSEGSATAIVTYRQKYIGV
jgi:photosystem II stability/assembly factor-like uncharacterized protein